MKRSNIFRQWLAVRIVALMGPQMPVKPIQTWSDRQLLDNFKRPKPGKNNPRLYSLANAIQLHGMHQAVRLGGAGPEKAALVGRACVERFLVRFDKGDRRFDDWPDDPWLMLAYQFDSRGELQKQFLTGDQLAAELTGPVRGWIGGHLSLLDADALLHALWRDYHEVDKDFNQKALEGRLKPWPKHLS